MRKFLPSLVLLLALLSHHCLFSQSFSEDFNFSGLLTANGWTAHSGGGTNPISTTTGLVFTGLNNAGNAAVLTTSGEDVSKLLTTPFSTGSVYVSCLVNVTAAKTAGDYFIHLIQGTTSSGGFNPRIYIRSSADGIQFGISKGSASGTSLAYTTKSYALNTTYLLVFRYTFNSTATNDDTSELFIADALTSSSEPAKTDWLASLDTQNDATSLGMIALRQGTAANAPNVIVDRLRAGDTWASVASLSSLPTLSAVGTTLSSTNLGTASAASKITVTASDLLADIAVSFKTATDNFEMSFDDGKTWGTIGTINQKGGVFLVRSSTKAILGNNEANILLSSGSISTSITVKGTVFPAGTGLCGVTTSIKKVRDSIPVQNTYTGGSASVAGRVTSKFGSNKFYLQDNTGGIAIFSASGATLFADIAVGDSVQIVGSVARFSGEAEILNPTCINKVVGAKSTPASAVFDASKKGTTTLSTFLEANEGKVVKLVGMNFTVNTGNFASATNYKVIACNEMGETEVRVDATATGVIGTTIPTVTQDITGAIGHYINTSGTVDILQVFPYAANDITKSATTCTITVPTPASYCGTLAGATISADSTLDITTWNVEWLGNTTISPSALGPIKDTLQMNNVITVINKLKSDVFCLEEVCNHTYFASLLAQSLPNYGIKCQTDYYSHYFDSPEKASDPTTYAQKICFVYKKDIITPVDAETKSLLVGKYTYPPANNWASGRLPYMFVADAKINGKTKRINFVGIHAKSGSAVSDYTRRKQDAIDLKAELDSKYASNTVIVLGDYNDDLDTSIALGNASSYKEFVADVANYKTISKSLSDCKVSSTASYSDIIDHIMVSNEIGILTEGATNPAVSTSGIYYVNNTLNVSRPIDFVADYTNSTSDHYPVNARFYFGFLPVKVLGFEKEEQAFYKVYPNPVQDNLTIDLLNAGETSEITIADMMGRVVWSKATNASVVTVPTSDFTKGLYIIRINRGKATSSFKIEKL